MKLIDEVGILVISAIRDITKQKKEESKFMGLLESAPTPWLLLAAMKNTDDKCTDRKAIWL